jgi:integrase
VARGERKPRTYAIRESALRVHLLPLLGHLRLDELGARHVDELVMRVGASRGARTLQVAVDTLRACVRLAARWEELDRVPHLPRPRDPVETHEYPSLEQMAAIVGSARGVEARTSLLVASRSGLRQGEVAGLQWPALDLAGCLLHVRRQVVDGEVLPPKGNSARTVPLSPEAALVLRAYRARARSTLWVWPAGRDPERPISDGTMHSRISAAAARAGLPGLTWHDLRHGFASALVARGVHLRVVQRLLGHASITTTERYAGVAPHMAADAVAGLDEE